MTSVDDERNNSKPDKCVKTLKAATKSTKSAKGHHHHHHHHRRHRDPEDGHRVDHHVSGVSRDHVVVDDDVHIHIYDDDNHYHVEKDDDQYQPIDNTPSPKAGKKSPRIDVEGKDEEEAVTAIKATGPGPTQDEVGAGMPLRRRRFVVFWLVLLGLAVVAAIVVVVIKFGFKPYDPVMPSSNTVSVKLTCFTLVLIWRRFFNISRHHHI
jgi:hypothetical protein